ncbi:hypothetical protein HanRHA438_Chr02g0058371 [Helianthus annuus]|nr:hypothetical protein HanHA300_Chr02g0046621 [Helianthus annuus]KAJ0776642.1 hypothetical protein HanLR1_Chr02g0048001 [Helianthus annuus]KAJ0939194.1 hypothetical protein HanRHA438_Chr02g0058371 [Helianthus annuus]
MDVAPAVDFGFVSSSHHGLHYASAPSSPTRLGEVYCGFDELLIAAGANRSDSLATVPFAWEEKPGVPKTPDNLYEDDFSFDVSCDFVSDSVPAEDLFQGGVIKTVGPVSEERAFSDRRICERGRERGFSSSRLPSSRSRRTRSLSPLGASDYRREQQPMTPRTKPTATPSCSADNGSKRWSFKDLFLFRSASEGRAMDKYPLKKYFTINWRNDQETRNTCESGSVSKRRGRVSAHELHYNLNRANSNEMKKKTYLPYKHGILGGLSFNQ